MYTYMYIYIYITTIYHCFQSYNALVLNKHMYLNPRATPRILIIIIIIQHATNNSIKHDTILTQTILVCMYVYIYIYICIYIYIYTNNNNNTDNDDNNNHNTI